MIDPKLIKSISAQVYRQYPEVAGVEPIVRLQPAPKNAAPTGGNRKGNRAYLLTYHAVATARDTGPLGRSFPHWVRVISDAQGHILKISISH